MQRQGGHGERIGYLGPEDWPGPAMRGSPYPMGYGAADPARGIEGNFRGVGPKGYRRSDERIRDEVCDRLTEEPSLDASGIEVSVRDGEVTLDGVAESRHDKRLAEDLTEGILGTMHVQNNLRIRDRSPDASGQSTLGRLGDDGSPRR
ncbi:MAG: BON domain-containing protein [Alphaproteobacteria bacterium]|nr:BON domain-containing protein [Alphaproteobacteria bacterium]MCW5738956.1 BON domain-containing protein [Alphaproteobacteria bacterium]